MNHNLRKTAYEESVVKIMQYTGKYKEMADQFRRDGCDEYTVEKFIRQEMELDEFRKGYGSTDIEAAKVWKTYPDERKRLYLNNAFCPNCHVASFAPGYNIRKSGWGLILEGKCSKCGHPIARTCD